jgi:hypothetical protein
MITALWILLGFIAGFIAFPLILFVLRDVLPPTLFMPSDWYD